MELKVTASELADFCHELGANLEVEHRESFPTLPPPEILWNVGKRYARVMRGDGHGHWSAYCFVDMTNGDLLKAASWKAPAKHARGNLYSPDRMECCNPYGLAYLR